MIVQRAVCLPVTPRLVKSRKRNRPTGLTTGRLDAMPAALAPGAWLAGRQAAARSSAATPGARRSTRRRDRALSATSALAICAALVGLRGRNVQDVRKLQFSRQ